MNIDATTSAESWTTLRLALIALAYYGAHQVGNLFLVPVQHISTIWPASGLTLAAVLISPKRLRPAIVAVLSGVIFLIDILQTGLFALSVGFMASNVLELALGMWLLSRTRGQAVTFTHVVEVSALIGVATLLNGGTALIAAATAALTNGAPFWASYWTRWTSVCLEILLVTPLVVAWAGGGNLLLGSRRSRVVEAAAFMLVWCAAAWLVFHMQWMSQPFIPHPYILVVLLAWAALRLGPRAVAIALVVLAAIAISSVLWGAGSFPLGGQSLHERLLLVQVYLGITAATGLLLTASQTENVSAKQAALEGQARLRALSDNLPNGMIYQVVREHDGTTRFLYVSGGVERLNSISAAAALQDPSALYGQIIEEDQSMVAAAREASAQDMSVCNVVVRMRRADGAVRWMQLASSPRRLPDGRILWDGISTDITERKQAEAQLRRANRALRTLSNCNQVLVRTTSESELLEDICRVIVKDSGYRLAWVGFAEHDPYKTVRPVAYAGYEEGYLETLNITWADAERGRGPTGTAIRTERPAVCHNFLTDPQVAPWREDAIKRGYSASLVLPLKSGGSVFGALSVYAAEADAFDAEEIELLMELADDLTYGIQTLRIHTERKRAAEALHLSEERFRSAMDHLPIGMAIVAPDGRWLEVNPALCRIVGYTREALLATGFQAITHPEDLAANLDLLHQLLSRQIETYQVEKRYIHQDGHIIWAQLNVSLAWNVDGTPRHFISQIQDITERKWALAALEQQRRRSNAIIESAMDGIITVDEQQQIIMFNPAAERMFRCPAAEAIGQPIEQFVPARYRRKHTQHVQHFGQTGTSSRSMGAFSAIAGLRADGEEFPIEASISRVELDGHKLFTVTCRDVTERQQAERALRTMEEQFRQSQKMEAIGQLAGGVAHDFNNILGAIMLQAEMAGSYDALPLDVRELLRDIVSSAERAANLTRQLLAFSRRQVLQPRQLNLNEIVTNLAKMLQRILGEDVHMQLNLHPSPLIAHADAGMLDQVLMNLVVNARDAMPGGGRLVVETAATIITDEARHAIPEAAPGRYVCLRVSDTGCGIAPEHMTHIFEPFFTTKEPGKGTGLGLATVFDIVKQHGGSIQVSSVVGRGTTFQVFLPASDAASESAPNVARSMPRGGTETILVVEDDLAVRKLTRTALERHGYQVLEAGAGVEALRMWEQHRERVHLLLTDMVMPEGMSGHDLAAHMQAHTPDLKVIFTSGYSADLAGQELRLQEGQNFLQKPAPLRQLLEIVRRSLDS